MRNATTKRHILIAICFGAVAILLALVFRQPVAAPAPERTAQVTVAPERQAIPIVDSNNDGVPDWQESFTDDIAVVRSGDSTDNDYTTPDTLTGQFAEEFFQIMVQNSVNGELGRPTEELVSLTTDSLVTQAEDKLITASALSISEDNSLTSLQTYGETIARIITSAEETAAENEMLLLQSALQTQDQATLDEIAKKAAVYGSYLTQTMAVTVPSDLVKEHLALVNSYQALQIDLEAMSNALDDPLLALLRAKRYADDVEGFVNSIGNLYVTLIEAGSTWDNTSPVYQVVTVE